MSESLNTCWCGQMQTDTCSSDWRSVSWPYSQKGLSFWAWSHANTDIQITGWCLLIFSQLRSRARRGKLVHLDIPQNLSISTVCGILPFLQIVLYARLMTLTTLPNWILRIWQTVWKRGGRTKRETLDGLQNPEQFLLTFTNSSKTSFTTVYIQAIFKDAFNQKPFVISQSWLETFSSQQESRMQG